MKWKYCFSVSSMVLLRKSDKIVACIVVLFLLVTVNDIDLILVSSCTLFELNFNSNINIFTEAICGHLM